MMKKLFLVLLVCFLFVSCSKSPEKGNFRANLRIETPTGDSLFAKLTVQDNSYSLDFGEDDNSFLIVDRSNVSSVNVFPEDSVYMQLKIRNPLFDPIASWERGVLSFTPKYFGDTLIAGYSCKHYAYGDKRGKVFEKFVSTELDFPLLQIFYADGKKSTMFLEDIEYNAEFPSLPEFYTQVKSPMQITQEGHELERTGPAISFETEFQFPFGFRISERAEIKVSFNENWKHSLMLINNLPDTAIVSVKALNMKQVLSQEKIILAQDLKSYVPEIPEDATSMIFKMEKGRLKIYGERERLPNPENFVERQYYLSGNKRTFWLNPSQPAVIIITSDSQDSPASNGVYRIIGEGGTEEGEFTITNGENKRLLYKKDFAAKSLICGVDKGSGVIITIRQ